MSTGSRNLRRGRACMASKLTVLLIAACFMTAPAQPGNCGETIGAEGMRVVACHAQTVAAVNMSFAIPSSAANAIVPAPALVTPLLAIGLLAAVLILTSNVPAAITHRRRFLREIWATTLPFKLERLHRLPYFSVPRDA